MAQVVERYFREVEAASSSLVTRTKNYRKHHVFGSFFAFFATLQRFQYKTVEVNSVYGILRFALNYTRPRAGRWRQDMHCFDYLQKNTCTKAVQVFYPSSLSTVLFAGDSYNAKSQSTHYHQRYPQ